MFTYTYIYIYIEREREKYKGLLSRTLRHRARAPGPSSLARKKGRQVRGTTKAKAATI